MMKNCFATHHAKRKINIKTFDIVFRYSCLSYNDNINQHSSFDLEYVLIIFFILKESSILQNYTKLLRVTALQLLSWSFLHRTTNSLFFTPKFIIFVII